MNFTVKTVAPGDHKKVCQVIGIFEDDDLSTCAKKIDKGMQGAISKLLKNKLFIPKLGIVLPLFATGGSDFAHVVLVGCGKKKCFSATAFKRAVFEATRSLNAGCNEKVICYLSELPCEQRSEAWKVKQIILTMEEASYSFDFFKSKKEPKTYLQQVVIHVTNQKEIAASQTAAQEAQATADGITLTKNLANSPSNICTPSFLADQALALGKSHRNLKVKILGEKEMEKLGMGALLGVSQGSAQEAKLICVEYFGASKPTKKDKSAGPICLVGKGVTFDTGGNSIKPADSMVGMKYDMCGAATVLGVIKAVAMLGLPVNVVGVIPAVENMPGGTAYKPEDILTSMSGQTIEVISTDAEGRLALCDAITYCEQRYQPDVVIDIATLTGAVVIALGVHLSGLMSNNDELRDALEEAGVESHDRAWPLPLNEEFQEQLKSSFADMANVGGRQGGAITAGCFLARFANKMKWAHLDVAGTAAYMMGNCERRATGRPVPLLMQYLINRSHDA